MPVKDNSGKFYNFQSMNLFVRSTQELWLWDTGLGCAKHYADTG